MFSAPALIPLAVVGAHLSGQPLNVQLTERNSRQLRTTRTATHYKLFALANRTSPNQALYAARLCRPGNRSGALGPTREAFGDFVAQVPAPMVIGTLELEDGATCNGFLCEPYALDGAMKITTFGGWRSCVSLGK